MNTKEIIGLKLKQKRIEQNISLDEVAKMLNTNKSTVSRWEQLGISDLEKINSYCKILNCDTEKMCFESPYVEITINDEVFSYNSFKYDFINYTLNENNRLINDCKLNKNIVCFTNDASVINRNYKIFKDNDYKIKIVNFTKFEDGNHYNPFNYLHTDLDVLKFVDKLIKFTTSNEKSSGDPFWDKSEMALLQALIFYLIKYTPKKEQNFSNVMKLLRAAEIFNSGISIDKSPLDIIFDEVQKKDPDSIALNQYKTFKMGAGKTLKSILISCAVRIQIFNIQKVNDFMDWDDLELDRFAQDEKVIIFVVPPVIDSLNFIFKLFNDQFINMIKINDGFNIENDIIDDLGSK